MIDILASSADSLTILAQIPGQNADPQAPPGMEGMGDLLISLAKWVGLLVAIIGVIVAGAAATINRNRGTSEEATEMAIKIALGVAAVMSAASLVGWFVDSAG